MTGFKPSPGQAAKAWATRYSDYEGKLTIVSLTPAGRGGWLTKTKGSIFGVTKGKAFALRESIQHHEDGRPYFRWNGRCQVCGAWFTGPVLATCTAPDPQAGEPIPMDIATALAKADLGVRDQLERGVTFTWHAVCRIGSVCGSCAQEHGLAVAPAGYITGLTYIPYDDPRRTTGGRPFVRNHPTLIRFQAARESAGARMDIRAVQRDGESLDFTVLTSPPTVAGAMDGPHA